MDKSDVKAYTHLIRSIGQLLATGKIYYFKHPVFKEKFNQVFAEASKLISDKGSITIAEAGSIFLINGEKIDDKDKLVSRFIEDFHNLQLESLELKGGLTDKEFDIFIKLLSQPQGMWKGDEIRGYLKEA